MVIASKITQLHVAVDKIYRVKKTVTPFNFKQFGVEMVKF
jgi:hypothetical protein